MRCVARLIERQAGFLLLLGFQFQMGVQFAVQILLALFSSSPIVSESRALNRLLASSG